MLLYTLFMKPEKVIVDWLYGYETPDQIQGTPVAFSTPHHMMHTPRNMEAQNTRIHYLTRSIDFLKNSIVKAYSLFFYFINLSPR